MNNDKPVYGVNSTEATWNADWVAYYKRHPEIRVHFIPPVPSGINPRQRAALERTEAGREFVRKSATPQGRAELKARITADPTYRAAMNKLSVPITTPAQTNTTIAVALAALAMMVI